MENYKILLSDWHTLKNYARVVRDQVFINEQQIPAKLEHDELDEQAVHIVAFVNSVADPLRDENAIAIATARLISSGQIGRLAVLKNWRRQGLGRALLLSLIEYARKQNDSKVFLHAQIDAVGFYQQLGFESCGEAFYEAGIKHLTMERRL